MNSYIAFFDLDLTLINGISGKILMQQSYKYGIMTTKHILLGICLSLLYKFNLMEEDKIIDKMVRNLKGISEATIIDLMDNIFEKMFKDIIREKAIPEIAKHKQNNGRTAIISASLPYVCDPIKDILEIDDVICSQLEVEKGLFTGKSIDGFCFGENKYNKARRYCDEHNFSFSEAFFYSDSITDLPLLQKVGNPVCICPDDKLRKIAGKNGWPINDW